MRVHRDATGTPYRWTITSLAFKGEHDPTGVPATWIIGQPAARAVEVLQRLQRPEAELLFRAVGHAPNRKLDAMSIKETNQMLNDLVAWINTYSHTHGRVDSVPDVDGQPWKLFTRQFRRTLAWHIARRPGGTIAGAIQYRHLSIQMFEGYAGTSDSGFRAEVESEQALARGEHLLAMTTDHDHGGLAGPAAAEAAQRLGQFAEHARFAGTVITDPRRLKRLMQRHDPDIHPGTYITCVFNPDKALCQPRPDTRGALRPAASSCQPLDCRNTALSTSNIAALRAELTHIDHQLQQRPALPPLLQQRLADRHGKITTFLDRHLAETS